MRIHIVGMFGFAGKFFPWDDSSLESGTGGTQAMIIQYARQWARMGHEVVCFTPNPSPAIHHDVTWIDIKEFGTAYADVTLAARDPNYLKMTKSPVRALWANDVTCPSLPQAVSDETCNRVVVLSQFQKGLYREQYALPEDFYVVSSAGVEWDAYESPRVKEEGLCIYMSTPERGLENLLRVWPRIRRHYTDARLFITGGFKLYGWDDALVKKHSGSIYEDFGKHKESVRYLGAVTRSELIQLQLRSRLMVYPTDYLENCCIAALETMAARGTILTSDCGALSERVKNGVNGYLLPTPATNNPEYDNAFVNHTVGLLERASLMDKMGSEGREMAREHDYKLVAGKLLKTLTE